MSFGAPAIEGVAAAVCLQGMKKMTGNHDGKLGGGGGNSGPVT